MKKILDIIKKIYIKKYKDVSIIKFTEDKIIFFDNEIIMEFPFENTLNCIIKTDILLKLFGQKWSNDLIITRENNNLTFKKNKLKIEIPFVNIEKEITKYHYYNWKVIPSDLMEGLKICSSYIANEGILSCFFIIDNHIYTSDNYSAIKYAINECIQPPFLLPIDIYKRIKNITFTHYDIDETIIYLTDGNFILHIPQINAEFLEKLVSLFNNIKVVKRISITNEMKDMLIRVGALINVEKDREKRFITMESKNDILSCSFQHDEGNVIESCICINPDFKIRFDPCVFPMNLDFFIISSTFLCFLYDKYIYLLSLIREE